MRRMTTVMLAGSLFLPALQDAEKPKEQPTAAEQFRTLMQEVQRSRQEFSQAYGKARTDQERQTLRDNHEKQLTAYSRRALEFAQKHPKEPVAVEALSWVITGSVGYSSVGAEIEQALDLLPREHVTSDKLGPVCERVWTYDSVSTKPERLLRDVLARNPHREIQGQACLSLARDLRRQASWSERLRDPARAKRVVEGLGPDVVKRLKASDPDKLLKEAEELLERTSAKYGDIKSLPGTLGEQARAALFEMRHLAVGKTAPDIEGEDIDGKRFKLSDYRGKVVLLDFWGHG